MAPVACAGTASLPSPWEALDWDWLLLGTAGPLILLGNETLSTPFFANVTAAHWQAPAGCRDVWLVAAPMPDPDGGVTTVYTLPLLYTLADAAAGGGCGAHNRSYAYSNTTLLPAAELSQSSSLFAVPDACNATAGAPGGGSGSGGGDSGGSGGVATVWVVVGCLLCAIGGGLLGVVFGRRQVYGQLHDSTQRLRTAMGASLIDAY